MERHSFEIMVDGYIVVFDPGNPVTIVSVYTDTEQLEAAWRFYLMGFGISRCKPGDVYDYEVGCRKALEAAFRHVQRNSCGISRADRTDIWALYNTRFPLAGRRKNMPTQSHVRDLEDW